MVTDWTWRAMAAIGGGVLLYALFAGVTWWAVWLPAAALLYFSVIVGSHAQRETAKNMEEGHRLRAIGDAFGRRWPMAPDALVSWVTFLTPVGLAQLNAWARLTIRDMNAGRDIRTETVQYLDAPPHVAAALAQASFEEIVALRDILLEA